MKEFNFDVVENKTKQIWNEQQVFRVENDSPLPKYYVLDMFPYPSGVGLHVGHPLGYVGSDILARFKRLKGFNVLHPMGYDSFGLPAEQYAIQTGQHPAITTERNIKTFRGQMDKLGFSFDWSREVRTSDPSFYKWTQWIFIRLFHSWYNKKTDRAEKIDELIIVFGKEGNKNIEAETSETRIFSEEEWNSFTEKEKSDVLLNYRLAYLGDSWVNWCAALGTVLANDEVKDGVSERGGYPVERKLMKQWSLRITAYAERLLNDLDKIDWSESIKESQRNWIGRSEGSTVRFEVDPGDTKTSPSNLSIEVFTTRPDTIFGVSYLALAPEHELIEKITAPGYKTAVDEYVHYAKNRSERERMSDVKKITGQFTGAYAIHPFSGKRIPVWIAEYVLAGYGTGAVMAVPGHDTRDYAFAKFFDKELREESGDDPVVQVVLGVNEHELPYDAKEGICMNSDFLDGLEVKEAIEKAIEEIEKKGIGKGKVNYKMRDAIFGRQRYWGEPIPVYYSPVKDGDQLIPLTIDEKELPLILPEVDKYLPTETGEPPLARAKNWKYKDQYDYEWTTMPGWAGSCWYYLRYEDPKNENEFASKEAINYWKNVDFYIGGDEHATGHLLYFRFWTKFLFDLGLIPFDEPAKKLVNQGKIQGVSSLVYRSDLLRSVLNFEGEIFISKDVVDRVNENLLSIEELTELIIERSGKKIEIDPRSAVNYSAVFSSKHVDISLVKDHILDINRFKKWRPEYQNAIFVTGDAGVFICDYAVEKMSKSKYNVVNPDDVVKEYGADALRMYEMFLGPLEASKPWDTNGIDGVFRFLKKTWRLFYNENGDLIVTNDAAAKDELKILHRTIKKVSEDIERLSFNTSVSSFMICVNELSQLNCRKRQILEPFLIMLSAYAPFIAEYLWRELGHEKSIMKATFPDYDESLLIENSFEYPVAVNGKTRVKMNFDLNLAQEQIEREVISAEVLQKYFEGKTPKKVIVVKGRMINVVV